MPGDVPAAMRIAVFGDVVAAVCVALLPGESR
jgi:hypothetical protein